MHTIKEISYRDDTLQAYFEEIRRIPLLSLEEELAIAKRIQQGDKLAKEKLIRANLRLVITIGRSFFTADVSFMDIVQEGNLGLMRAAEKYDPDKNARFSTYASWWIRQYISRFMSNKRRTIRLPHRKEQALRKIQKAQHSLRQILLREPTIHEIAEEIRISPEEITFILNMTNGHISLEIGEWDEENASVVDVHEDYTYNPEREFFRQFTQDNTLRILNRLKTREKWILIYRYQLKGCKRYTLRKLGDKMNLSPETVRQLENKALKEIRRHYEEEFRETLYEKAV
ncbi:MAG: RNA polymerase sigma factor RpoD/SigA [Treponema sp.]|jgi:RNA polymerase primary sigma factor|nr:RNA polymerase sigma factor RpoD/SigA [Treponema sp.]